MSYLVICPLENVAEAAVRHKAGYLVSLLAKDQTIHRPGLIQADHHLRLEMNDISTEEPGLITPDERHVRALIEFFQSWKQDAPTVIHCWMGVSRSPAAAIIAALAIGRNQSELELAKRLRAVAPFATPNRKLIEIADKELGCEGRLVKAVAHIGRGADTFIGEPFRFDILQSA